MVKLIIHIILLFQQTKRKKLERYKNIYRRNYLDSSKRYFTFGRIWNFIFYWCSFWRCYNLLLVFSIVLLFDIKGIKHDSIHSQTVLQKIELKLTNKSGYILLFLLLILEFFSINNNHFLPFFFKLLVCRTIAIFLFFANENRSRYYASFWLESVLILWCLVLVVLEKWFFNFDWFQNSLGVEILNQPSSFQQSLHFGFFASEFFIQFHR